MSVIGLNPWQREGVSILPNTLSDLMPLVGQKRLFNRLGNFRREMLEHQDLSGFFIVIGGWGVGKSRVGHELCLEAFSDEVSWIIDGRPERLLQAGLQEGILPIFLRYVQVTRGPLGDHLETENWIESVIVEALAQLADLRSPVIERGSAKRNQDRILDIARTAFKPKGWDRELPALQHALQSQNPHTAARQALDVLKRLGIARLWLIVDEIEDITDVERDGLPASEREGIDQALLTVIPRVIKSEEDRQKFPEVNFLLLCSLAVGDLLRQIRAIERRTGWHELNSNTFADVEAFFQYLQANRPAAAEAIRHYPHGLKEAAFFAANRNFGWFNVVMHHVHQNFRSGAIATPDLLRSFAETSTHGGRNSVFELDAIGEFRIPRDADYADVERCIFSMLPQEVENVGGIAEEQAARLLHKLDHGGQRRPVFTRVVEIKPPPKHRIMAHMISCGFQNTRGSELALLGEARFDLGDVLDSLQAYSIALPPERRAEGHLLICEDEEEFKRQVSGLSPYPEQADQFAPYLHALLIDSEYRVNREDGTARWFVAPAFSFLLDFNRLNKVRQEDQGYLRDSAKNSRLEEACQQLQKQREERITTLLQGIANCWEGDKAPATLEKIPDLHLPAGRWTASQAPLNLAQDRTATVLYATGASESDLEHDLNRLAQRAAEPVLLILEDEEQRIADLSAWINRIAPRIAPFVAIHNLARIAANDHLIRLGLLGKSYNPDDLRTSHFHAVIGRAREHLKRTLDEWRKNVVEEQGLLVKPVFYGTRIAEEDIQAFAKGYAALLSGKHYHDIMQSSVPVFEDERERDRFTTLVNRNVDPPTKLANAPLERLLEVSSGEYAAVVPRVLLALLDRCGPVPVRARDLEGRFVFDVRDEHGSEVARPRDVLRHLTLLLQHLGLLKVDGDKLTCKTVHELQRHVESAEAWLDSQFERDAQGLRRIHEAAGDDLLNVRAKDARHRLKQAERKLKSLDLDFIGKSWADLNQDTADDMPLYEQRLRAAVAVVRDVQQDVFWVYDPEGLRLFRYNPEALAHFDTQEKAPSYPLWKRLAVLRDFYTNLDEQRKQLLNDIKDILEDVDHRVPELTVGSEAGQKAFPTQALTRPLDLYKEELHFGAANPEKTVAAGSTTFGITTVGYKLAAGKYLDALERLKAIHSELHDPGKLGRSFLQAVETWDELRTQTGELDVRFKPLEDFFADAPEDIRDASGLDNIRRDVEELHYQVLEGGIRALTDSREAAGHRVHLLIEGLWEDLKKIEDRPRQVREQMDGVLPNVLRSIQVKYQSYNAHLNAAMRICFIQGEPPLNWPEKVEATYGKTVAAFEIVVKRICAEGTAYFKGAGETTFDDFVGFCKLEMDQKMIDWHAPENQRHVPALMERKLLQLRLAGIP